MVRGGGDTALSNAERASRFRARDELGDIKALHKAGRKISQDVVAG